MAKAKCPKCGRMVVRIDFHQPSCDKFPLADELLQIMQEEGLSQKQIAKRFDVSPHYVRHFVEHFGLREMCNPYSGKHGRNIETIAGDANCDACGVKVFVTPPESWGNVGVGMIGNKCEWCHEKGHLPATKRNRNFSNEKIVKMRDMRKAGHTYEEIALQFDASFAHVQRVCTGATRLAAGGYIEGLNY